eukprot:COSAG04_NODE_2205_length_4530_cov_1.886958_1_plen_94_part_00
MQPDEERSGAQSGRAHLRPILDHLLRVDQRQREGAAALLEEVGDHAVVVDLQRAVAGLRMDELTVLPRARRALLDVLKMSLPPLSSSEEPAQI